VAPKQNFDEFFDQRHHRRVTINGEARINFGGCWHGCRIIDISGGYEPDALVDTLMLAANSHLLSRRDHLAATTSDIEGTLGAEDEEADGEPKKKARGVGKLRRLFGT
jgi:hypothetical protein